MQIRYGHVVGMEDSRWLMRIMTSSPWRRQRGRSKVKSEKEVDRVMKKTNLTSDEGTSRQVWRLTSGNWRTTGKLIDTEKYILWSPLAYICAAPSYFHSLRSKCPLSTLSPAPKISNVPPALCCQHPKPQMFPSTLCYQHPRSVFSLASKKLSFNPTDYNNKLSPCILGFKYLGRGLEKKIWII